MKTNRRVFLSRSLATLSIAGTSAAFGSKIWAQTSTQLGTFQIDTLSDGNLVLPGDFVFGAMPQSDLGDILSRYNISREQVTPDCNLTLLRDGERTILFDAGSGPDFMQTAGKIGEAFDVLGLDPGEITHVVFTHAHPDHLWGVLDDFDEPFFHNATYLIGQAEWGYWTDPKTVETIGENRTTFAIGAQRRLLQIEDKISFFKDDEEILPGVASRACFGHTPGHMAFELRSGSESLMVVGDAIANHHVAFEQPGWISGSDQDGDMAAQARVLLLDQIATAQMPMIGFHLPYPGIGRVERTGSGFRFIP